MLVTTKELFEAAYGKYAIGAYSINNLEQCMGLFQGNVASNAPFIIQISKGARSYTDKRMLEAIITAANEVFPEAIFAVHLTYGDEASCMDAIASNFYTSVHIDTSYKSFEEKIAITKRIADAAHAKGLVIEATLGLPGCDCLNEHDQFSKDNPENINYERIKDFINRTGADSLACAIGHPHGAFKFTASTEFRSLDYHFYVLEKVQKKIPEFPLVMSGYNSTPKDEVRRINIAGGKLANVQGVNDDLFLQAAKLGVTKINIDMDGRLVWCRVHREHFILHPEDFDLRPAGKEFMAAYADFVAAKNVKLGSAGHLDEVRKLLAK